MSPFSGNPDQAVSWSPSGGFLSAPAEAFFCQNWGVDGKCEDDNPRLKFKDYATIPDECNGPGGCLAVWNWTADSLTAAKFVEGEVWQTAWAPNGQELLVGVLLHDVTGGTSRETPSQLWRWDLTNNTLTAVGNSDKAVLALAYSDNGDRALAAYGDGVVLVWDAQTDAWSPLAHPLSDTISAAAWLPDEDILLGTGSGAVYLWNGRSWSKIVQERDHLSQRVTAIVPRPDAPEILTTSEDGTVRVWRNKNWELADLLLSPDRDLREKGNDVYGGSWSASGGHIASATLDQKVRLWLGRAALAARLVERVCSSTDESEIKAEIPEWQGCQAELAAVADNLAQYKHLMNIE